MQTKKERDTTIDFIKGFLILLVILGHTTLGLVDMYSFNKAMNNISNFIYSFHMPCFIAVSGYLYKEYGHDDTNSVFRHIRHKAFNILLPYVMVSIIYWIIKYAMSSFTRYPISIRGLINIPWEPIEFLWYLYALFFIYCVGYIVDYLFDRYLPQIAYKMELLFCLFFVIALISYGRFHYVGFNYIAGFQMYFYLGCVIKKWIYNLSNKLGVIILFCLSLVFEMYGIFFQSEMSCNSVVSNFISRITACIVTFFIFSVCYFIARNYDFPKWVQMIGHDSMPFYAMHVIFVGGIRIILDHLGITNIFIHCICGFIGSCAICWVLYEYIIKKIKIFDFVFYPKKVSFRH